MNYVKELYCRAFQGVFRMLLPILPYRRQKVYTGVTAIPAVILPQFLEIYGAACEKSWASWPGLPVLWTQT